ncbi:lipoyl domain-containing protein [Sphingomonas profundi]|uniref:lipoyl domain-containing protein n=1 Tax=Alterirhizorhabdus profundi TaxID=2681549 RepID=UPI0012E830D1|nr:lipoyl domain-containing protein [Sphingomonas profundi]
MIYRLAVPDTLEDVTSVRVLEWHGAAGTAVAPGAMIVELETHKALIEVRAEQAGVIRRIDCAEGEWCPLGGGLALLSDAADEPLDGDGAMLPADFRIG